jgi:hypothetical protein
MDRESNRRTRRARGPARGGAPEWERPKQVGRRPEILREAAGKAIKAVAPLPAQLRVYSYRVIYMDRLIGEAVESQRPDDAAPRHSRRQQPDR